MIKRSQLDQRDLIWPASGTPPKTLRGSLPLPLSIAVRPFVTNGYVLKKAPFTKHLPAKNRSRATANAPIDRIAAPALVWKCTICNKWMFGLQKVHLTNHPSANQNNAQASEAKSQWTCIICDKTMTITSKESHLAGKQHVAQQNSSRGTATKTKRKKRKHKTVPLPASWTCNICDRTIKIKSRASHLASQGHAAQISWLATVIFTIDRSKPTATKRWKCTTCGESMALDAKGNHLAGEPHKAARWLAGRLGQQAAQRDTWSMAHVVDRVDTQRWKMRWEGVYKDSSRYEGLNAEGVWARMSLSGTPGFASVQSRALLLLSELTFLHLQMN